MPVQVHTRVDDLPDDAQALMRAAETASSLYEGTDWFRLLATEVPPLPGGDDVFAVLHRGGRCRLVLPLRLSPAQVLRGRQADALGNYYTGLYAPAADASATASDWAELLRALLRGRVAGQAPIDRLRLQPLSETVRDQLKAGLAQAGLVWREQEAFGNWHETVQGDFEAYWAARPGALRSTAARASRRFARAGGTLEIVTGGDAGALQRAVQAYETVYRASWKPQEPHPGFMPGLVALAARRGWLRLGLAWLNGRPLAAHLWLVHGGRAEIYKLAYAEDAAAWSLGTLLGQHLMAHVIGHDRVHEVDYLIGDDDYKRLWMGQRRARWCLDVFNPRTARGALFALGQRLRGR